MTKPTVEEMLAHLQEGMEWYENCDVCRAIRDTIKNQAKYDALADVMFRVADTLDGHLLTPALAALKAK